MRVLTCKFLEGVLDRSHLSLLEEEDIDQLGISTAAEDQDVVVDAPVSDLTFQDFLEDALALTGPNLEHVVTLVELLQPGVEDLYLEDGVVLGASLHRVVSTVRLYAEQI